MYGYAVVRSRCGCQTARPTSSWATDYLRRAAIADLGCVVVGVLAAVQLRFGNHVIGTHIALSLALPVLWLAPLGLAGGYDVRFIETGSDEFRKVLNVSVSRTASVAIFSCMVKPNRPAATCSSSYPVSRLLDLVASYAMRKRLHKASKRPIRPVLGRIRSGPTCDTWRTGRSPWTCRFCGRRCGRWCGGQERFNRNTR